MTQSNGKTESKRKIFVEKNESKQARKYGKSKRRKDGRICVKRGKSPWEKEEEKRQGGVSQERQKSMRKVRGEMAETCESRRESPWEKEEEI